MRRTFSDRHSINHYVIYFRKPLCHTFFQLIKMFDLFIKILIHHLRCHAKTCDSRHIISSGAHSILLSAAQDQWLHLCFTVNVKKSDTFWSVDLMSADRKKMDSPFLRIDPIFAKCLNCIYMIQCFRTLLLNHSTNFFYRHHCSGLIVYHHCRY